MHPLARFANQYWFCISDPQRFGGTYRQRKRYNGAVFVDPDRRFLFVKNEKCGNNTARRTLQFLVAKTPLPENFTDTKRWHAPLLQPSDFPLKRVNEINGIVPFKFAIVRNPYARLLSCYLDKFADKKSKNREKFVRTLKSPGQIDFAEFIAHVGRQQPEEMDPHWRIQYDNIYCGIIKYDAFVKFEEYETQFHRILGKFFDAAKIESVRKGKFHAEEKLSAYYNRDLARMVREKFSIDFEHFHYDPNLKL